MKGAWLLSLVGVLALNSCSRAPAASAQLDALFQAYQGDVPGASVLVVHDRLPIVRRAYGLADLEAKLKATSSTHYRLGSITKQFTAACILLLMEQGRLRLEDPLRQWLPSLPQATAAITLREVLTHTSGLIDYEELIPDDTSEPLHDADVLTLLEGQDRVNFAAGSAYRYSNSGYALLALVVGKASGQDFATFLRDQVFRPLRMTHSVAFEEGISTVPARAYGYSLTDGTWQRTDQSLTSAVLGDGGIYASIDDLARWDTALSEGRLLKPETWQLAFAPTTATDDPQVKYGFGWRITGDSLWHPGGTKGFSNVIVRFPAQRLTVVVLTNRDESAPYGLALQVAKLYYPDADRVHAALPVPDAAVRSGHSP